MISNYSKKDINFIIDLFILNKSILLSKYKLKNNSFNNKFINKFVKYLNFLGFLVINNYKIKIYVNVKNLQIISNSVVITQKI